MFGSARYPRILDTGGLLAPPLPRPAGLVRLGVPVSRVSPWANAARMWELINRFFPETVEDYDPGERALDLLGPFLHDVENARWWEIDWQTLDYLYEVLMNCAWEEDDEVEADYGSDGERAMLACLYYIPAKCYNWSTEQWWNMDEYPILTIFKKLLDSNYNQRTGYPGVDNLRPTVRWLLGRCEAVAKNRGEPFDILPRVADYVMKATGNPLLDNHSDSTDFHYWPRDLGFEWDRAEDVERLKQLYAEAGPTRKRIETLCGYLDTEDTLEDFLEEFLYGETEHND